LVSFVVRATAALRMTRFPYVIKVRVLVLLTAARSIGD
jgi:hypothetical protein